MTEEESRVLEPGLYILDWHSGGRSVAAVGITSGGDTWMAPTNWVNGPMCGQWHSVRAARLVMTQGDAAAQSLETNAKGKAPRRPATDTEVYDGDEDDGEGD